MKVLRRVSGYYCECLFRSGLIMEWLEPEQCWSYCRRKDPLESPKDSSKNSKIQTSRIVNSLSCTLHLLSSPGIGDQCFILRISQAEHVGHFQARSLTVPPFHHPWSKLSPWCLAVMAPSKRQVGSLRWTCETLIWCLHIVTSTHSFVWVWIGQALSFEMLWVNPVFRWMT